MLQVLLQPNQSSKGRGPSTKYMSRLKFLCQAYGASTRFAAECCLVVFYLLAITSCLVISYLLAITTTN